MDSNLSSVVYVCKELTTGSLGIDHRSKNPKRSDELDDILADFWFYLTVGNEVSDESASRPVFGGVISMWRLSSILIDSKRDLVIPWCS
jgi:hypothetical protein